MSYIYDMVNNRIFRVWRFQVLLYFFTLFRIFKKLKANMEYSLDEQNQTSTCLHSQHGPITLIMAHRGSQTLPHHGPATAPIVSSFLSGQASWKDSHIIFICTECLLLQSGFILYTSVHWIRLLLGWMGSFQAPCYWIYLQYPKPISMTELHTGRPSSFIISYQPL